MYRKRKNDDWSSNTALLTLSNWSSSVLTNLYTIGNWSSTVLTNLLAWGAKTPSQFLSTGGGDLTGSLRISGSLATTSTVGCNGLTTSGNITLPTDFVTPTAGQIGYRMSVGGIVPLALDVHGISGAGQIFDLFGLSTSLTLKYLNLSPGVWYVNATVTYHGNISTDQQTDILIGFSIQKTCSDYQYMDTTQTPLYNYLHARGNRDCCSLTRGETVNNGASCAKTISTIMSITSSTPIIYLIVGVTNPVQFDIHLSVMYAVRIA